MSETIAAIATGNSVAAIGVIRLSGARAVEIAERVFTPRSGRAMSSYPSGQLVHGELRGPGGMIDLCLCTLFRAPGSYTGEDTAEFQCHGSPTLLRLALEALFHAGARQALPGEFTKRAFLNGRMDLPQAEAVADIINADSPAALHNAVAQLSGAISKNIDAAYFDIVGIISHFHAVLDYPDDDVEAFEVKDYAGVLERDEAVLRRLLKSVERGRVMSAGVRAAIIGRPNAGKSSLLNALLGFDRAIVSSEPGTTRDTVEGRAELGGVLLRLFDTAGLREAPGAVERLGVERAKAAAGDAELVFAVFDGSEPLAAEDFGVMDAAGSAKRTIAVLNKTDLPEKADASAIEERLGPPCRVSALCGTGLEALDAAVRRLFPVPDIPAGEILTNARQADAVQRALDAVIDTRAALQSGITPDAVLTCAEAAASALGEIEGRTLRDDVISRIFERFCVGK